MKEAAQKSFGKSKETVEETAKSAAKVVEQTVHKTVEKVRGSASSGHDHDELWESSTAKTENENHSSWAKEW